MTPLQNSENCIIYGLAAGKPNPCGLLPARVFQSAQKGPTCQYYAMNMIRNRIGKCEAYKSNPERAVEQVISARRKEITELRFKLDLEKTLAAQLCTSEDYRSLQAWTKKGALDFIHKLQGLISFYGPNKDVEMLLQILTEFIRDVTSEHLMTFIQNKHNHIFMQRAVAFLSHFGKTPPELFAEYLKETGHTSQSWDALSLATQRFFLENFCFKLTYKAFQLKVSDWSPKDGIKSLVSTLAKNGPMYVKGMIGKHVFEQESKAIKKFSDLTIHEWDSSAKTIESSIFHSVVVTGAEDEESGKIYFVDPADSSDPSSSVFKKTYSISYDLFLTNLGDLNNFYTSDKLKQSSPCSPYGLHMPT